MRLFSVVLFHLPLVDYFLSISLSNKSFTFPFENRKNIAAIALSPDGNVLISVDEGGISFSLFAKRSDDSSGADGRALLVNARRGVVLHHFNFHKPVKDIQFSPNGSCVMLRIFFCFD